MVRGPGDHHFCPLFGRRIYWGGVGGCYEIAEVREGELDMKWIPEPIDVEQANVVCEQCGWHRAAEWPDDGTVTGAPLSAEQLREIVERNRRVAEEEALEEAEE